jgi:hypothetical protein
VGKIIMSKEADRFSYCLSATRAADPVHIILGMTGKVVIDYVGDTFYIDSTRRDIGCDEDANTARLKILECTESLILGAVGMESRTGDS